MSTPVINAIDNVNDATLNNLFQAVANNAAARESLSQSNRNIDAVVSNVSATEGLGDNAGQDEAIRLCLCRRSGRDPANFPNTATDIIQDGTFRGEILGDAILSGLLSASQPGVAEIASSATLSSELAASQPAMQAVANSPKAFDEIVNSQTAMQEVAASQTAMQEVAASQTAMQDVTATVSAMQEVAGSQAAMQEVAASQTAMQEVAASQTAMQEVGLSSVARNEIESSNTATTELSSVSKSFSFQDGADNIFDVRRSFSDTAKSFPVFISDALYTGYDEPDCVSDAGLYTGSDAFLGQSISNIFVSNLRLGWETKNSCSSNPELLSGEGNAVF